MVRLQIKLLGESSLISETELTEKICQGTCVYNSYQIAYLNISVTNVTDNTASVVAPGVLFYIDILYCAELDFLVRCLLHTLPRY